MKSCQVGPGWAGRGVSRARHQAEPRGRDQSPAGRAGQDPDYLARFTREAQVLASLNHPNIAIIHGVEESLSIRDQQRIAKAILSPPAPTTAFRNVAKPSRIVS